MQSLSVRHPVAYIQSFKEVGKLVGTKVGNDDGKIFDATEVGFIVLTATEGLGINVKGVEI